MIDYLALNMEKCVAATTAVSHFEASINWLISNGINSVKFSCSKQSILQTGLKNCLKNQIICRLFDPKVGENATMIGAMTSFKVQFHQLIPM